MTLKEAVLISVDEINRVTNYLEVYNHIVQHKYYNFGASKTPASTISAVLGGFIRAGDSRIKRIKQEGGTYLYYSAKYEHNLRTELLTEGIINAPLPLILAEVKSYQERDLHKLLATYLKSTGNFAKTIYHEQSNGKDNNQTWSHPDMVAVKMLDLKNKTSHKLLKSIKPVDAFTISSYELKKEINSDSELKKGFFQAVSNSSWANYGFLVALEFSGGVNDEMRRLNQSFGIGVIKLASNPFESRVLYPAKFRDLDFETIDKLCLMNSKFEEFLEQIDKLMTAEERYYEAIMKEMNELCDKAFLNEAEIKQYCADKNIPTNDWQII